MCYVILQKLGRDVKSIVLKFPSDQTISQELLIKNLVTLPVKHMIIN